MTRDQIYRKPLPQATPASKQFWEFAAKHILSMQKCRDCGEWMFYPRTLCLTCLSSNLEWRKMSGEGEIYTFSVVHQAQVTGFEGDVPYICAIIELEEGPRILSNLVGIAPQKVKIGMPVEVVFDDVAPGTALPKFKVRKGR